MPILDSVNTGRVMRATERTCPDDVGVLPVNTLSAPMLKPSKVPDNFPPATTSTCSPFTSPILRVKNGRPLFAVRSKPREKPRPPNSKAPASCRKKSRVSGKNNEKRVVLI